MLQPIGSLFYSFAHGRGHLPDLPAWLLPTANYYEYG